MHELARQAFGRWRAPILRGAAKSMFSIARSSEHRRGLVSTIVMTQGFMVKQNLLSLLSLFGFLWLFSSTSHACDVLLKITTTGFAPNGYSDVVYRTRITCNGNVMRGYRLNAASSWHEQVIASVEPSILGDVMTKLSELRRGVLVVPPGQSYADAPTITYVGHNNRGEQVTFFEYSFGQYGKLESFPHADELMRLIDSF